VEAAFLPEDEKAELRDTFRTQMENFNRSIPSQIYHIDNGVAA
jgi:hypothetical protein